MLLICWPFYKVKFIFIFYLKGEIVSFKKVRGVDILYGHAPTRKKISTPPPTHTYLIPPFSLNFEEYFLHESVQYEFEFVHNFCVTSNLFIFKIISNRSWQKYLSKTEILGTQWFFSWCFWPTIYFFLNIFP